MVTKLNSQTDNGCEMGLGMKDRVTCRWNAVLPYDDIAVRDARFTAACARRNCASTSIRHHCCRRCKVCCQQRAEFSCASTSVRRHCCRWCAVYCWLRSTKLLATEREADFNRRRTKSRLLLNPCWPLKMHGRLKMCLRRAGAGWAKLTCFWSSLEFCRVSGWHRRIKKW